MTSATATPTIAPPKPTISEPYLSDPMLVGNTWYVINRHGDVYPIIDNQVDSNPVFQSVSAFRHSKAMSKEQYAEAQARQRQAEGRYAARPYPCHENDRSLSYDVIGGVAYCSRCAPRFRNIATNTVGVFGTLSLTDTTGKHDRPTQWATVCCGDHLPMPTVPNTKWSPGWTAPTPAGLSKVIRAARARNDAYLPAGVKPTHSVVGDAPVLPEYDRTPAKPSSKPTPQPKPVAVPTPEPSATDWERQYHVAEANVILLRAECEMLRRQLARRGVTVAGPIGLGRID